MAFKSGFRRHVVFSHVNFPLFAPCGIQVAFYGANTFIGSLYMCALRCAQEMATLMVRKSPMAKMGKRRRDKLDQEENKKAREEPKKRSDAGNALKDKMGSA